MFNILNKRLKEFGGDIRFFGLNGEWFDFEQYESVDFIKKDNRWQIRTKWKNENTYGIKELNLKDVYCKYSNNSKSNYPYDFILFCCEKDEPYPFENEEVYDICVLEGKYQISFEEWNNGYALIEHEAVELAGKQIEIFERENKNRYFCLTTKYHYLDKGGADSINSRFHKKLNQENFTLTPEILVEYCEEIKEVTKDRLTETYDHNMNLSAIKLKNDPRRKF